MHVVVQSNGTGPLPSVSNNYTDPSPRRLRQECRPAPIKLLNRKLSKSPKNAGMETADSYLPESACCYSQDAEFDREISLVGHRHTRIEIGPVDKTAEERFQPVNRCFEKKEIFPLFTIILARQGASAAS
jgi:hypothetical protein